MCAHGWRTSTRDLESGYLGDEIRIEVSELSPGRNHVQVQALCEGEWVYLTVDWESQRGQIVKRFRRHFTEQEARHVRFMTFREFVEEQVPVFERLQ